MYGYLKPYDCVGINDVLDRNTHWKQNVLILDKNRRNYTTAFKLFVLYWNE